MGLSVRGAVRSVTNTVNRVVTTVNKTADKVAKTVGLPNPPNAPTATQLKNPGQAAKQLAKEINAVDEEISDRLGIPSKTDVATSVIKTMDNIATKLGLPTSQDVADKLGIPGPLEVIDELKIEPTHKGLDIDGYTNVVQDIQTAVDWQRTK